MKKKRHLFLIGFLGASVLLATFVAPFASSAPNGWEKIARRSEGNPGRAKLGVWSHAPFSQYLAPGFQNQRSATAMAGMVGTLLVFVVALGLSRALVKFRHRNGTTNRLNSPLTRLDARAKIVTFVGLIVACVSSPADAYPTFAGFSFFLVAVMLLGRIEITFVLRRLFTLLPIIAVMTASLAWSGTGTGFWIGAMVKAAIGLIAVVLLSATTSPSELLHGFERLKVPSPLILTAAMAHRYMETLMDEAARMKRARDSRAHGGRWLWQVKIVGQMIGALFLRAYERAERIHLAMLARGCSGRLPRSAPARLRPRDYFFTGATLSFLAVLRLAVR